MHAESLGAVSIDPRIPQQGRQDSNLQPTVLETVALPVELRPFAASSVARRLVLIPPRGGAARLEEEFRWFTCSRTMPSARSRHPRNVQPHANGRPLGSTWISMLDMRRPHQRQSAAATDVARPRSFQRPGVRHDQEEACPDLARPARSPSRLRARSRLRRLHEWRGRPRLAAHPTLPRPRARRRARVADRAGVPDQEAETLRTVPHGGS